MRPEMAWRLRNLLECAAVLASLRINGPSVIEATIKEAAMPLDYTQSSFYKEGEARGRLRGMLELRFGPAGADVSGRLLERLALLDDPVPLITEATSPDDLARRLEC